MKKILVPLTASLVAIFSLNATATTTTGSDQTYKAPAVTPPAPAASTTSGLTGNFDLTTNYMFRGISNSSNLPAVQGGLTYTFASTGIYFNIWGSSINFPDTQGNTATLEIDTIAGITNPIGDNFTYNINIDRYNYPKAAASYSELIASAQWYFITALVGYSTNVYDYHHNGTYYNLGFNYNIPSKYLFNVDNVNVSGGIGHYSMQRSTGMSSYDDYNIQVSKTIGSYVLAVQWTDTGGSSFNLPNDPTPPTRGSHILGTVTVNF